MIDSKQLIDLAKEIEKDDPIKWDGLNLDRDAVYNMLAMSVLERIQSSDSSESRELILLATAINLVVANFVLEMRLGDFDDHS